MVSKLDLLNKPTCQDKLSKKKNKITHLDNMNTSLVFQNSYCFTVEARKDSARPQFRYEE